MMTKVELLTALPGCCYLCRSSNREWYIDTGQSLDQFGALVICNECIMEMARHADMLTPAEYEKLKGELETAKEEVFDSRVRISGLEQAIDGLRVAGSVVRADSFPPVTGINDTIKSSSSPKGDELGVGTSETSGSLHDEGVAEFPDDADSEPESFTFNL